MENLKNNNNTFDISKATKFVSKVFTKEKKLDLRPEN